MSRASQRGMTLAEVLVAIGIVGVLIFATLTVTTTAVTSTKRNMDKQFATQKAISILEEMKALVQVVGGGGGVVVLDNFDDGVLQPPMLTIQTGSPGDPVSGNLPVAGGWLYSRQISVARLPGQSSIGVRMVRVRIYKNVDGRAELLAEVASVVRTLATVLPQTQVYDVYVIAAENVPGWWVYMARLIPTVQNAIADMQSRNPGLVFRVHTISTLSYGRDPFYRPYVNVTADSNANVNWVYFYPGRMPNSAAVNQYYPVDNFRSIMRTDSPAANTRINDEAAGITRPYSLADQFNHGVRYPEEVKIHNERIAAGLATSDEPTYRMLIDDMYLHPERYQNAIIINLHGELFPFPPVRNYSDAAKEPENLPNVRVVAHPERLTYGNTDNMRLRVYSYRAPSNASTDNWLDEPISVLLKNVPSGAVSVDALTGGTNQTGSLQPYAWQSPAPTTSSASRMYAEKTTVIDAEGTHTLLKLYNSPLISPCVKTTLPAVTYSVNCSTGPSGSYFQGLPNTRQLYGMEYMPSPAEDIAGGETAFSTIAPRDLTTQGDSTKNTARWRITIADSSLSSSHDNLMMSFETRIGDDLTAGVMYPAASRNQPSNLSTTYIWRGTELWLFGDGTDTNPPHVPITEQYQLLGDPRHEPYAEVKAPHLGSGLPGANRLGMHYNRYFDDFHNGSGNFATTATTGAWRGWTYTASTVQYGVRNDGSDTNDGWTNGGGQIEYDMNRVFESLRTSLISSRALWTTMTGYSYYYSGFGNEIGYDAANQFPSSIPVSRKPFTDGSTTAGFFEDSITGSVKYIRENDGGYWWGVNWLGELYPDGRYDDWEDDGNLPTGTGVGFFRREPRQNIAPGAGFVLPAGTTFRQSNRRTQTPGGTTLFWTGTSGSTFHHSPNDGATGGLTAAGIEMSGATTGYNYPLLTTIPASRPFNRNISATGDNPVHFLGGGYPAAAVSREESVFYSSSDGGLRASALYSLRDPSSNKVAFVVVNGLSPTGASGTAFIARWSFLSMLHSFLTAGLYTDGTTCTSCPYSIGQVPRVTIATPNLQMELLNPASINVTWTVDWERWDGEKYTPNYSSTYNDTSPLSYYLLYSQDNGASWRYIQDDSVAVPGVRPTNNALRLTGTSYNWSTPTASVPNGSYLLMVEAYRDDRPLHYAYHQFMAFIRRT